MLLQNSEPAQSSVMALESEKPSRRYNIPEGLTRSQKRNYKKVIREKAKKEIMAHELRKFSSIFVDPINAERLAVLEDIKKQLRSCPMFSEMKAQDVLQCYSVQQSLVESLLAQLTDAQERLCNQVIKSNNRKVSSACLLERLKTLSVDPKCEEEAIEEIRKQAALAVACENARMFNGSFNELKQELENRLVMNKKLFEALQHKEHLRNIATRVASFKTRLSNPVEITIRPEDLKCVQYDIPSELIQLTASFTNVISELGRLFCVVLERSAQQRRNRSYALYGLPDDVHALIVFVSRTQWNAPCKVTIPPRHLQLILGKGYREIKQLEESFQCIINIKSNGEVFFYGPKEAVAKLQQHFEQMKNTEIADPLSVEEIRLSNPDFGRALMTTFNRFLRKLEEEWNVIIRCAVPQKITRISASGCRDVVSLPFGGDFTSFATSMTSRRPATERDSQSSELSQASVSIRGRSRDNVQSCKKEIQDLLQSWTKIVIPVTSKILDSLYASLGGNVRPSNRLWSNTLKNPLQRFGILVDLFDNVAFLKEPEEGIILIGPKEVCEKAQPDLLDIIDKASHETVKLHVPSLVAVVCCSVADLHALEEKHQVDIRKTNFSKTADVVLLTFTGRSTAIAAALEEIQQTIRARGQISQAQINDDEIIKLLSRPPILRDFESKHDCRVFLNKIERYLTLVGPEPNIKEAENALPSLVSLYSDSAVLGKKKDEKSLTTKKVSGSDQDVSVAYDQSAEKPAKRNFVKDPASMSMSSLNCTEHDVTYSTNSTTLESFDSSFPSLSEAIVVQQLPKHGNRRRMRTKQTVLGSAVATNLQNSKITDILSTITESSQREAL